MRHVVAILIGIVTTSSSFAQFSLGVQGTGNLSDAEIKAEELIDPRKSSRILPGAGVVVQFSLSPSLAVRTGVNYQQNGIELKTSTAGIPGEINSIDIQGKINLHYIQVPLNILFTTKGPVQFFAGGGPYASLAVSGKGTQETTYRFADGTVVTEKEKTDVFEKNDDGKTTFRREDFGVGAIAGVKLPGGLFANVGYQYSFTNLSRQNDEKYKNRGLQLTIGYYFFNR